MAKIDTNRKRTLLYFGKNIIPTPLRLQQLPRGGEVLTNPKEGIEQLVDSVVATELEDIDGHSKKYAIINLLQRATINSRPVILVISNRYRDSHGLGGYVLMESKIEFERPIGDYDKSLREAKL